MTVLTIMGSGETAPTMVTTHQRVLRSVPTDRPRVLLDTPYGFQANADDITAKARAYLARNVGVEVEVVALRRTEDLTPVAEATAAARVAEAGWVFAGPGSPTYLARQWRATSLSQVLRDRLSAGVPGSATVFASAAAVTLGAHVVPVYEIYKAGHDVHWEPGLDLLSGLGLDVAVVPHFDNTEGGSHDTRYCYLGPARLAAMEDLLPAETWVLGIDEHTAMVADLTSGQVRIEGRGGVTVRARGTEVVFPAGTSTTIEALVAAAEGRPDAAPSAGAVAGDAHVPGPAGGAPAIREDGGSDPTAGDVAPDGHPTAGDHDDEVASLADATARAARRFDAAFADDRPLDAAEATVWLLEQVARWSTDVLQSDDGDRADAEVRRQVVATARLADAGLHEHAQLVAPLVELLLELRDAARRDRRFADADRVRDVLVAAGVEVRDAADGTAWAYDDPLDAARP